MRGWRSLQKQVVFRKIRSIPSPLSRVMANVFSRTDHGNAPSAGPSSGADTQSSPAPLSGDVAYMSGSVTKRPMSFTGVSGRKLMLRLVSS